ncbi:MAG: SRPBCC family protein [Flavisolibacter sp.]|nr:SRPBCC family protein [Flavisolibacter sp.]
MQKVKCFGGAMLAFTLSCTSCTNGYQSKITNDKDMETIQTTNNNSELPKAHSFVASPLRNRIKLKLNAPVSEVWAVIGDPSRMPEYSEGLQKVESKKDERGNCIAYTCYFKPMEAGGQEVIHSASMKWYEPNHGWASLDEEPNPFGLQQSLTLITLEPQDKSTILNWEMHFNAENEEMVKMNVSSLEQALNNDIAQRLIQMFGGKVLESYVEGKK